MRHGSRLTPTFDDALSSKGPARGWELRFCRGPQNSKPIAGSPCGAATCVRHSIWPGPPQILLGQTQTYAPTEHFGYISLRTGACNLARARTTRILRVPRERCYATHRTLLSLSIGCR